ncbi:hypothetical protein [Prevotella jejuni]|jgi:hypothetical protein|uniref:hypothetical protein n=1 Tax=Prevotella jejuni TaxID=1177574 RepID=UPI002059A694|nr:MAG TPA: hypothetical protein [Caudoviricetes sp.]DAR70002.1 MAG TPA: hypothetical protein [Caudoviricetes sp.]DAS55205.1 MAG TPA: hypothetical protein [Caudoviricetes sp.]
MKNISELASQNNLSVINIGTSFGLKEGEAVVGFTSFQEAVDFAERNDMNVATFKNEGETSSIYTLFDESPRAGFDVLGNYEDFTKFFKGDAENFQEVDIDETLENSDFTEDEREEFLKDMSVIKTRIENLAEDEFIFLDNSGYSEPMKKEDTSVLQDGNLYVIGVY